MCPYRPCLASAALWWRSAASRLRGAAPSARRGAGRASGTRLARRAAARARPRRERRCAAPAPAPGAPPHAAWLRGGRTGVGRCTGRICFASSQRNLGTASNVRSPALRSARARLPAAHTQPAMQRAFTAGAALRERPAASSAAAQARATAPQPCERPVRGQYMRRSTDRPGSRVLPRALRGPPDRGTSSRLHR